MDTCLAILIFAETSSSLPCLSFNLEYSDAECTGFVMMVHSSAGRLSSRLPDQRSH
jgi:hypothetical protein